MGLQGGGRSYMAKKRTRGPGESTTWTWKATTRPWLGHGSRGARDVIRGWGNKLECQGGVCRVSLDNQRAKQGAMWSGRLEITFFVCNLEVQSTKIKYITYQILVAQQNKAKYDFSHFQQKFPMVQNEYSGRNQLLKQIILNTPSIT